MKLLDIGSSAVPSALCFKDCDVFCLEPLLPELLKIGYPFWYYYKRARFIYAFAEEMPFPDSFFDAIIAVNSLDHVDDFYRCSAEIRRVSKPDVKLRFHLHYHKATSTEPLELSDAIVAQAFSWCAGFHKVEQRRPSAVRNSISLVMRSLPCGPISSHGNTYSFGTYKRS